MFILSRAPPKRTSQYCLSTANTAPSKLRAAALRNRRRSAYFVAL
jgi:hypothetical protein